MGFIFGHGVVIYFIMQSILTKTAKTHLSVRKANVRHLVILSTASAIITHAKSYEHSAMDGWVRVLHPYSRISVTSRRWKVKHERLCAMKHRLGSGWISPPVVFEPATQWSEVRSTNHLGTRMLPLHHVDILCGKTKFITSFCLLT